MTSNAGSVGGLANWGCTGSTGVGGSWPVTKSSASSLSLPGKSRNQAHPGRLDWDCSEIKDEKCEFLPLNAVMARLWPVYGSNAAIVLAAPCRLQQAVLARCLGPAQSTGL